MCGFVVGLGFVVVVVVFPLADGGHLMRLFIIDYW